ncbi:MAG: hypothetical protein E7L41_04765 [Escherichia coli]|nr:hypothetical protein [Escherichia coli]
MKTSKTVAKLLFVVGALVYLVGLWISCPLVALITIGLLFIGVLNAPINAYEMVIYPIAFFVCLFGQMRLFRSA